MANSKMLFIYLDKNILQYDCDGILKLETRDNLCFVYSEEHFNEISRSEDERIFNVLQRIKARKLKLTLDSKFNITDQPRMLDYQDPRMLYDEHQNATAGYKQYSNIFIPLQPFFMGNIESVDPHLINEKFVTQIKELMKSISVTEIPQSLAANYEASLTNIGDNLEKALNDAKEKILPIEQMRKKFAKKNLSELNQSDGLIVDQIWSLVKDKFPGIEKDQLFGKKPLPYMKIPEMPIFRTVVQCHSILNTLGYYPDKGLTKISKVYGINSDASHLAHSIFCSGIISADDHLCKKANAIFQYLGLNKAVIQLKFGKEDEKRIC